LRSRFGEPGVTRNPGVVSEELEPPDEVFGFGNWLLWVLATRATDMIDEAFTAGPARPSKDHGMVDGHPVPTASLVAWLLVAAESGIAVEELELARRDGRLNKRQKVLRTIVSRAIGGESRLFKDTWLRGLGSVCGLGEAELELLASSRGHEGFPVDPPKLRTAIGRTLRAQPARAGGRLLASGAAVTRSLPRDIASFTGREPELDTLMRAVEGASAGSGAVVGIHAIGGMAGIGKTTFAVHAAHMLAGRYPDGQIFLHLHGHTPGHHPVDPADALASLLLTAGVPAQQILPDLEARMTLWRDRSAGKRLLLLLDDAVDSEQVSPLLPGSAESLVLVTSRRHLTALEDAQAITLEPLLPDEAVALLVRLAARPRLDSRDPAAAEIADLCGYLPLAVGMLGRKLHHHPAWAPNQMAADLAAARNRLEQMQTENLSVAAAFDLSYHELSSDEQRVFRRLGLHPGTDVDAYATAALDDADLDAARRYLEALYDRNLLTEPVRGRYRMHDLIRQHARTLAANDPATDRDGALARLLDYYQLTAAIAEGFLARQTGCEPAPWSSTTTPELLNSEQALLWARAERANLLACLEHVSRTGQHARVVALTAATDALFRQDGPWADAIIRHTAAVQAARHLNDRPAEARALNYLGFMRTLTADFRGAAEALEESLSISRDLGDRLGQANALNNLGMIRHLTSDYPGAIQAQVDALSIYRALGDRLGQASALKNLGAVRRLAGDYPGAIEVLEMAVTTSRDLGDRLGQAGALTNIGAVRLQSGDYSAAAEALGEALKISQELADRREQSNALFFLGVVRQQTGDYPGATEALEASLQISYDVGNRLGQANALKDLGIVRRLTRDYPGATEALEASLGIYREIDGKGGEAEVLNEMGILQRLHANLDHAEELHLQALALARAITSLWDEAHALANLGRCALAAGSPTDAESYLRQAWEIFQRIGGPEGDGISTELDALARIRLGTQNL
jgi:tetratricopeptide (TPR) repeat protein